MKQKHKGFLMRALALGITLCLSVQMLPVQVLATESQAAQTDNETEVLQDEIADFEQQVEEVYEISPDSDVDSWDTCETDEVFPFGSLQVLMVESVADDSANLLAESTNTVTEDYYWEDQWFGTFTIDADTGYIIEYTVDLNECDLYEMHIPDTVADVIVTGLSDAKIFCSRTNITAVTMPNTVTYIGDQAFNGCSALSSVELSANLTYLGERAFGYCDALTEIDLPDTLETLENQVFMQSDGLTEITLPGSITAMGSYLFSGCANLTAITLEEGITQIGQYAFRDTPAVASISLPTTLETVGSYAFNNCPELTSITFPGSVTELGGYLFDKNCTALTSVTLEEGITTIGASAFARIPGDVTFSLPSTLTTIEGTAFDSCAGMTAITLPENLTTLGGGVFGNCVALTEITLPGSITAMGTYLFAGCTNLTAITLEEGITQIGQYAFRNTPAVTSISLPTTLETVGSCAFQNCPGLTSITFPAAVTSIGSSAFASCTSLTEVSLPAGLTELGANAFNGCTALTGIALPTGAVVGTYAFRNTGLTTVTSIPSTAEAPAGSIGSQCFMDITTLTGVSLGEGFTKINSSAFKNCAALTDLELPDTLTDIFDNAFENCTALAEVDFPGSLTRINGYAFRYSGLTSVTLPASITTLGYESFAGCTGLQTADLSALTITSLPGSIMDGCTGLTNLKLNSSLQTINSNGFRNTALTSLTIPSNVRTICESAFENVPLTDLTIEDGSRYLIIAKKAFAGSRLDSLTLPNLGTGYYTLYEDAFAGDTLTSLTIGENKWQSFNNSTYGGWGIGSGLETTKQLINGPFTGQPLSSVTLENSTCIPHYLFSGSGITSWDVLTDLVETGITTIGYHAFQNCAALQGNPDLTGITEIGNYAFSHCNLTELIVTPSVEKLGSGIVEGCADLQTVTFAEGATNFKAWPYTAGYSTYYSSAHPFAYNSAEVQVIFKDESLTAIPDCLFAYCQWFDDLSMIPNHITSYGIGAFAGSSLTSADIPAHITYVGEQAFNDCTSLADVEIRCPSAAFTPPSTAYYREYFKNVPFHAEDSTETNLRITADWTEIPDYIFAYSALLDTDFLSEMPELKRLGTASFQQIATVERVTIPSTVTNIGYYAFYESFDYVTSLVLPESVTTMEVSSGGTYQQFYTTNTTLKDVYILNPDLDLRQSDFELHVATPSFNATKIIFNWKDYSNNGEYLTFHASATSTNVIALTGASENHYIFSPLGEGAPITVVVRTPDGSDVTADCAFRWINAAGVEKTGSILYPDTAGLTYTISVSLGEDLICTYTAPADRKVTSTEEEQTVEIVLDTMPVHTFTGTVADTAGSPLPGAAVTLIQQYNGTRTEMEVGVTDKTGTFTVTAVEAPSQVRVTLDHYYTGTAAAMPGDTGTTAFPHIQLKSLPATTILLNPVVTTADAAAAGTVTLPDLVDLTFKVTRKGDSTPLAHSIQDTTLVLEEPVGVTEELVLSVTKIKERAQLVWNGTPIAFTLEQAQVDIPLTEYGRFAITAEDYNTASGQWVWVFDKRDWTGPLVASYELEGGTLQSDPLPAGNYRVVVIDKTCPVYNPPTYARLTGDDILDAGIIEGGGEMNLIDDIHFKQVDITVEDGVLTEAAIVRVPRYAEASGLNERFVDIFEKAELTFSSADPIVGQDYYVTFDFSVKEEYRSVIDTGSWKLTIDLPAYTRFNDVYPAYVGGVVVPQPDRNDQEGTNQITITLPTGMNEGRYTFSLRGLARQPDAAVTFTFEDGYLYSTPISKLIEIRDVKIDPGFTTSTDLENRTVTVTALPRSYVTLYMDHEVVGTKQADNLGMADFTVTYPQPYYEGARWRLTAAYQTEEGGELLEATDSVTVYYGNQYELGAVLDLPGERPSTIIDMNAPRSTGKTYYTVSAKDPYWTVYVDEGMQKYVKDGVITMWGFRGTRGKNYDVLKLQQVGDTNAFRGEAPSNIRYYSVAIDYDVTEAYKEEQAAKPIQIPAAAYAEYEANLQAIMNEAVTVVDDPNTEVEESAEALEYEDVPVTQYTGFDQLSPADQQALLEADASYQAIFAGLQDASEQIWTLFGAMPNWGWQGQMTMRTMGYEVLEISEEDLEAYIENESYSTYWMADPSIESVKEYPMCVYTSLEKMEIISGRDMTLTRMRFTEETPATYSLRASASTGVNTSQKKNGLTSNGVSVDKENEDADCPSYNSIYEYAKDTADNGKNAMNIGADSVSVAIERAEAWLEANAELFMSDKGGPEFDQQYMKLASSASIWKKVLDKLPFIGGALDLWTLGDLVAEQMTADAEAAYARSSFHEKYEHYADNPFEPDQDKCVLRAQAHLNAAIDYQNALANQTVSTAFQVVGAVASVVGLLAGGVGAVPGLLMTLGSTAVDWHLGNQTAAAKQNLDAARSWDPMGRVCPKGEIPPTGGGTSTGPLYDPSGYIYEGVFSNRVEGVTASAYYQGEDGEPVFWSEAERTGQPNPYVSHSDGYYGWITPEGKWAVTFEKEGYESADSRDIYKVLGTLEADEEGWLPVLPIQTEVHMPLESTAAPSVEQAMAYEDGVSLIFSQYMHTALDEDPAAAAVESHLTVMENGTAYSGSQLKFKWLDAEYSGLWYKKTFGRQLMVSRADGKAWEGPVTVAIDGAQNYVGTALSDWASEALTVLPVPVLAAEETLQLEFGGTGTISLVVQDKDKNALSGIPVAAVTDGTYAPVKSGESSTGSGGLAQFTIDGYYMGEDTVTLSIPGRPETLSVRVSVTGTGAPNAPMVTIDGKIYTGQGSSVKVPKGTVAGVSGTPGNLLYYSIGEDSCPCESETQILIENGTVALMESGYYKFAASANGEYSNRVHIYITVAGDPEPEIYEPTVTQPQNGSITVEPQQPKAGDAVTVRVVPDEGYEVKSLSVTDSTGAPVTVTQGEAGTYTYTQPEGMVSISAVIEAPGDSPYVTLSNGILTIINPAAEADEIVDMTIMVAGYTDSRMNSCQVIDEVTGVTETDLTVSGDTIKVFFLDPVTCAPLFACVER